MTSYNCCRMKHILKALCRSSYLLQESKINVRTTSSYSGSSNEPKPRMSMTRLGLISVGLGALFGTGYSFHKLYDSRAPIQNKGTGAESTVLKSLPNVATARSVISPTDNTGLKLKLFQYPTCPFCCKVRAFLDYHGFSYDVVEVDPVLRQEIKWSHYKKVPILLAQVEDGYQQLNDSSMIISALMSYLYERDQTLQEVVKFYPNIEYKDDDGTVKKEIMNRYFLMFHGNIPKDRTKEDILLERQWRKWVDDVLVHTLSPNVYRTRAEAFQAFSWFSEVGEWDRLFPVWERFIMVYVGAVAMWIIGKRLKRRHNLKDDVRQSLYDECNFWIKTVKKQGTPFLGGSKPNLADLAVYGALTSIEGCNAFTDLLTNTKIGTWYYAMKESVQNRAGSVAMSS